MVFVLFLSQRLYLLKTMRYSFVLHLIYLFYKHLYFISISTTHVAKILAMHWFSFPAPAVLSLKTAQEEIYSEKCLSSREQLSLINYLLAISRYSNNISYNVLTTLVSVMHTRYNINDRAWDIGLLCIGDG